MKRLGDIHFAEVLPDSIKRDPTINAAAESLNGLLNRSILSVPNLLLWARLAKGSAQMMKPLARLTEAAGGLKPHTLETLELLAWQLHVDFRDVAATPAVLERMVRESIPWHRIKGTPAAVERALAMYGIEALTDECGRGLNWAVYELELATAPDLADLPKIIRLAGEAAPVRCRLRRLHDDYNLQPIIWGEGPPLSEGYWGDDSGVWDEDSGLKLSFRKKIGLLSEKAWGEKMAGVSPLHLMAALIHWPGLPIWGHWRFGDKFPDLKRGVRRDIRVAMSESLDFARHNWRGAWDRRRWGRAGTLINRRLDRFLNFSKSEFILSESRFGDKLQALSGRGHLAAERDIIWGEFRFGESNKDYEPVYIKLHELFIAPSVLLIEAASPQDVKSFALDRRAELISAGDYRWGHWRLGDKSPALRHTPQRAVRSVMSEGLEPVRHSWSGHWDSRRWASWAVQSKPSVRHLNFLKSFHVLKAKEPEKTDIPGGRSQAAPSMVEWPNSPFRPRHWQGPWQGRWRPPVYMNVTSIGEQNESGNLD